MFFYLRRTVVKGTRTLASRAVGFLAIAFALGAEASVSQVSVGDYHTCAVLSDGSARCWGMNVDSNTLFGTLGDGSSRSSSSVPVSVVGITNATGIAAASPGFHSCAVLTGGSVTCWGWNAAGQLGDGTKTVRLVPVPVSSISTATSVVTAHSSSCAMLSDGSVQCWGERPGRDFFAAYDSSQTSSTPVTISGIPTVTSIALGTTFTCILLTDGSVQCWGNKHNNNDVFLGDGTNTGNPSPVTVSGVSNAKSIAIGSSFSCALLASGSVKCWGVNNVGQLGDQTTDDRSTPVPVFSISTATSISAGMGHACAVLINGTVQCWGINWYGQLGDGTTTSSSTPVSVVGITNATSVSAGGAYSRTCAVLIWGSVQCWGRNSHGQLGDGSSTDSLTPVNAVLPTCDASVAISDGIASPCSASLASGSSCSPTCNSGYILSGSRLCGAGTLTDTAVCLPNPCDASTAPANGGVGDCPSSLASGSTCQPTCNSGYVVSGTTSCNTGMLTAATCSSTQCDASTAPTNGGVGTCTNSLASGSTCQPTCDSGYTVSGTSSCSLGTLTAATCSANSCTASSVLSKDGSDGVFYCINGGTVGGTTGACTCTSCIEGYGGASCETAGACSTSTDPNKDGADGSFYCINGGTVGGTAGSGSCTCTSCNSGYEGVSCQTVIPPPPPSTNTTSPPPASPPPPTPPPNKTLVLDDDDHAAGLAGILVALVATTFNML